MATPLVANIHSPSPYKIMQHPVAKSGAPLPLHPKTAALHPGLTTAPVATSHSGWRDPRATTLIWGPVGMARQRSTLWPSRRQQEQCCTRSGIFCRALFHAACRALRSSAEANSLCSEIIVAPVFKAFNLGREHRLGVGGLKGSECEVAGHTWDVLMPDMQAGSGATARVAGRMRCCRAYWLGLR